MRGHSPLPHIGLLEIETGDGLHRILKARPALAVPHNNERIRVVRQRAELRLRRIELVLPAARWLPALKLEVDPDGDGGVKLEPGSRNALLRPVGGGQLFVPRELPVVEAVRGLVHVSLSKYRWSQMLEISVTVIMRWRQEMPKKTPFT